MANSHCCPHCQRAFSFEKREEAPHFPFCSERCRMSDLLGWMKGEYRISRPLEAEDLLEEQHGPIDLDT